MRVLVTLRRRAPARPLARMLRRFGARPVRRIRDLRVVVVRVPRRKAPALVARLGRTATVKAVARDRAVMRITASNAVQETPTDPLWTQQWGATLTEAPTAWAVTRGSPNVVVAVLDTGVDFSQPDLQGAFVPGYDFVNGDDDPSDDHGHGTEVSGIIAARADNGLGGTGFCPKCSIMPVKVVGSDGAANGADVASGITWATDHGARVVNLSLGGVYNQTIASAVSYAVGKGVLVVAAAGNNGNSNAFYPAAYPGVLSVAATQQNDTLYSWSNYGGWVAVAAPGCDLTTFRGGQYGDACGTSASAPVVSGLAALALSYSPTSSVDDIRQAITSSARAVGGGVTYGRVDVADTLAALGATFKPAPAPGKSHTPAPAATPTAPAVPAATNRPRALVVTRHARPVRRPAKHPQQKLRRVSHARRAVLPNRVELFRRGH